MKLAMTKFITLIGMVMLLVSAVPAQPVDAKCAGNFLTFPAWHEGLTEADCTVKDPETAGGLDKFIWKIALNVLNTLIQLVAYVSAGFILYGGFTYLTSGGSSDKVTAGRKMIQNALIGLVISLFAVFAVSYVAGNLV